MAQHGPRTEAANLAARYWLTPAGEAAAEQALAAIAAGQLEPPAVEIGTAHPPGQAS